MSSKAVLLPSTRAMRSLLSECGMYRYDLTIMHGECRPDQCYVRVPVPVASYLPSSAVTQRNSKKQILLITLEETNTREFKIFFGITCFFAFANMAIPPPETNHQVFEPGSFQCSAREIFNLSTITMWMSINTTLLLWPLHIHHKGSHEDEDPCVGCIITPISPSANSRDVCDCRLLDPLNVEIMDGTDSHIMIGLRRLETPMEKSVNCLPMYSVFDRYNGKTRDKPIGFFDVKIDFQEMKSAVTNLLRVVDLNFPHHVVSCSSPEQLIFKMLEKISSKYNHFKNSSDFCAFLATLQHQYNLTLPMCISRGSKALQATFMFQQVFPYCIAFLNGNHRHARWAFQLFNCDRQVCHSHLKDIDILKDDVNDGYIIKTAGKSDDDKDWTCHLHYQFYSIKEAHKSSELTLHQLQSISERCNIVLKKSLEEEACHR